MIDGPLSSTNAGGRSMKRNILVILSNRWDRSRNPRFIEVESDDKGTVLKETRLRREPREARYDEVWENDEGKSEFAACFKFSRKYGHKLQKPK